MESHSPTFEYQKSLTRLVSLKMRALGGLDVKCVDGLDAIRHRSETDGEWIEFFALTFSNMHTRML